MPNQKAPKSDSSEATLSEPAAPAKSRKARAPKKSAASASVSVSPRSAAPGAAAAPVEIIYDQPPNPYHPPAPPYIWIDHPEQSERLLGPVYVVRLGIGGAEDVEISIDGDVWQPCRLTSGYWWFDWSNIRPGRHTLTARMRTTDGRWFRTPPRPCEYRP